MPEPYRFSKGRFVGWCVVVVIVHALLAGFDRNLELAWIAVSVAMTFVLAIAGMFDG